MEHKCIIEQQIESGKRFMNAVHVITYATDTKSGIALLLDCQTPIEEKINACNSVILIAQMSGNMNTIPCQIALEYIQSHSNHTHAGEQN